MSGDYSQTKSVHHGPWPTLVRCAGVMGVALGLWGSPRGHAGPEEVSSPSGPHGELSDVDFVQRADELVKAGTGRKEVPERLRSIAVDAPNPPGLRLTVTAVRAAFAIADGDQEAREVMLGIAENAGGRRFITHDALRLLVFVADEDTDRRIAARLEAAWPGGDWMVYIVYLQERNSPLLLEWAEAKLEELPADAPLRRHIEFYAESMRLARDPDATIAYLASREGRINRAWLARQAVRSGVETERLADAVRSHIRGKPEGGAIWLTENQWELVEECKGLGLLTAQGDRDILAAADRFPRMLPDSGAFTSLKVPWAEERIQGRRALYYRAVQRPSP